MADGFLHGFSIWCHHIQSTSTLFFYLSFYMFSHQPSLFSAPFNVYSVDILQKLRDISVYVIGSYNMQISLTLIQAQA